MSLFAIFNWSEHTKGLIVGVFMGRLGRAEQHLGPDQILNNKLEPRPSLTRAISTWPEPNPT